VATIQIRDVPDDVYEDIRRSAQVAGQSLQAYMRTWLIDMHRREARRRRVLDEHWALLDTNPPNITREEIVADIREDRDSR
jgi:hypothetical protein